MPSTVGLFGLKAMSAPPPSRPNFYDADAAIILDASRIQGVANGARVSEVMARGTAPEAVRTFDQTVDGSLFPIYRSALGPAGRPCLEFTGSESLTCSGVLDLTAPMTFAAVVRPQDYGLISSNRRILGSGGSGASPSIRPTVSTEGAQKRISVYGWAANAFSAAPAAPDDWMVICASIHPAGPSHMRVTGAATVTREDAWSGAAQMVRPLLGTNTAGAGLGDGTAGLFLLSELRVIPRAMSAGQLEALHAQISQRWGIED